MGVESKRVAKRVVGDRDSGAKRKWRGKWWMAEASPAMPPWILSYTYVRIIVAGPLEVRNADALQSGRAAAKLCLTCVDRHIVCVRAGPALAVAVRSGRPVHILAAPRKPVGRVANG